MAIRIKISSYLKTKKPRDYLGLIYSDTANDLKDLKLIINTNLGSVYATCRLGVRYGLHDLVGTVTGGCHCF